ncbi:uncharacterized protein LOC141592626 [Silene latifolia]|uniref:uncharacterized protein LOC141592626 n=1 Tax=Silene latifolia TaxID=37657 RepID=UPI003D78588F
MEDHHHQQPLLNYELRLLRCTLSPPPSNTAITTTTTIAAYLPLIDEIITLIETGRYVDALSSTATRSVFRLADSFVSSTPTQFYAELDRAVESFLIDRDDDKVFLVVSVAVAALLAFLQCNFTGPVIELPSVPLPWLTVKAGSDWEDWARVQLMSAGSDLSAKFEHLQFLVFAKILLMKTRDLLFCETAIHGLATSTWWLARLILLQQHILDECCSSLFDLLQVFMAECLSRFGDAENARSYWGALLDEDEALTIVSMVQLEAGLVERAFKRVDHARRYFKAAASAVGFDFSVSGALGYRTVHQVEPKAQWVLVANKSSLPTASPPLANGSQQTDPCSDPNTQQNHEEMNEISDILMAPRIVGSADESNAVLNVSQNGHASGVALKLSQQAVILAECLLLEEGAQSDELQRWEMAPYIETIDSQQSSCYSIKFCCNVLRIRWESTRSRTKERALLLMDKQVKDIYEPSPQVPERVYSCFGVNIPAVPSLRKEYAQLLVSRGLIGEALKIFEDLELWDSLIYCYRLLEKKAVAVELIKTRLSEAPNDPKLWCSLGDVTNDDACYEKALEVSNDRSTRAKRSLARSAYNRGDFERSKVLWESAMALNTLYPDGWFALGSAALKARDINKAVDGFTRAVQLDPDNGEAWNNLACLHMMRNKSEEAFIAFKEALKFKRNNWQMWKNFGPVAADVGNLFEAVKAIQMVLDLSGNKSYDGELVERLMQEMERRALSQATATTASDTNCTAETALQSEFSESRETKLLMESLGKILKQIVLNVGSGDMWGLYARWHKLRGDPNMCLEALQKQVRSYQGSEVGNDITQFRKFARASLDLCNMYIEISSSTGSRRELHSADMHLRNTIKRAITFSDTEEYKALQSCLDQVEIRLKSESLMTASVNGS